MTKYLLRLLEINVAVRLFQFQSAFRMLEKSMKSQSDNRDNAADARRAHRLEVLDSIFRAVPAGIGLVKNRVIVQANDRLCEMIGYTAGDLLNQSARMLYPTQEDFEWVGREKYEQIDRMGTGTVETRWQHKDGRIIDVLLSSTPLDLDDPALGLTFTALDITARKQAEKTIAAQKSYLALLHDITLGLLDRRDPDALLQQLVTSAAHLAGTSDGFAYVFDENADALVIRAACGRYGRDLTGFRLKPGEGLAGKVWQHGETFSISDYRSWEGRSRNPFFDELGAALAIPIRRRAEILGVLGLGHFASTKQFGRLEREALERLADLAALCLENASVYDNLQKELSAKEKVEAALRASENRYRSVFENTGTGTVLSENDTTLSMVNEGFAEISGYAREEIEGRMKWTAIIDPDDHARMLGFHRLRREDPAKAPKAFECRIIDRQGRRRNMMLRVDLIPGTTTSVGSFMDITGQKETEAALRKYEQMVTSSTDYMALVNRDYVYLEVNQAYQKVVGRSRTEIVGSVASEIFGADYFARHFQERLDRCLDGEEVHVKGWYNTPGLGRRYIDTFYYPSREADGRLTGVVIVGRDLTHLKKLEDQFLQSQRMEAVGTLAGGIAHDFNNLLMGIQGRASLMATEIEAGDPFQEHVEAIESYVRSAADLTSQLLGFAQGGKYEIRPTDLNDLIRNHNRMFSRTRKELTVQGTYARDLPAVEVDRGQIKQVLLNIYLNAWQAMPEGGTIYVETIDARLAEGEAATAELRPGRYATISVRDTGLGMDEAVRQRVFEPFFTTRPMGHGTGLGLASAYGIVRNHGGAIDVYSEKGRGTTFRIYLPASRRTAEAMATTADRMQPGGGTVMLVDDEAMIIEVGTAMLQKLGYDVLAAADGESALSLYRKEQARINLVILDMVMPGMGGGETFDQLKSFDPDVKVLLSSGYSLDGQATEIIRRGCVGFIQKPFSLAQLSAKLKNATA